MGHSQDHRGNSYLCLQTKSLRNVSIITDEHNNIEADIYSIGALFTSDITEIVANTTNAS